MAQQTAVKFIEQELINVKDGYQYIVLGGEEYVNTKHIKYLLEQAKAMEKKQTQKAFSDGQELSINNPLLPHYSSEEYYNDTYTQCNE